MPVTVGANFLSVVHKGSNGIAFVFPDVCLTPAPPAPNPVPIPYPNIAMSSDSSKTAKKVKADGNPICHQSSTFSRSTGDEPGVNKGVASGTQMSKAEFVTYSFDVKAEGKGVTRAFDLMLHNSKNTPPAPLIQPPLIVIPLFPDPPENPKPWAPTKIEVE